ncbi:YajG family lipoprotein [Pseudemcibacter aquimaris]|uniref:YajG family lipoprotein n=1 Tax=Pseudemcibacter aquimaris TaxID=2857064 RepID=UPI0020129284|nr:YajG family lipoprotein [Pseudemcibacter aquimaris]MCC3860469.1 YajG family lipoprotein [Pseudemcibacter aquimaris]WDU59294.1 YajG family lipoprotein [Pseudemcibacter aquimaris]
MKKFIVLLIVSALTACASVSQDAVIAIYPKVTPSNVGHGLPLSISVEDNRPSGVIGTYGDGGQISTSQDMAQTIGIALVDSFSKMGFSVTDSNDPGAIHLHIFLEEMSYTTDGGTISTDVETKTRVKVEAVERGFNRTYSNSEQRTIPFSSNPDTNNSQLSNTLNATVQRIVSDNELITALAR